MDQELAFIDNQQIDDFMVANPSAVLKDIYNIQIAELQRILNPADSTKPLEATPEAVHIYYPWQNVLLKTVNKQYLDMLRTNRNKNLINSHEQSILQNTTIGVAGMSVGAGMAIGFAYSGIADNLKLADNDILETANLNRLRESLLSVGTSKAELAARHIYEVNPYAQVELFNDGITADTIDVFFTQPAIQIMIDEIDDFKMKIQLRVKAREHKVPVIMFTSLGDNILVDIERYDLEPELPFFNNLLPGVSDEILQNPDIDPADIRRYSVQLVGQQYISTRALESVAEMGQSLVGRPQLYGTIAVDGGLASYVIRNIILNNTPQSGRYFIKFSELFKLDNTDFEDNDQRKSALERIFSRVR